MTTRTYNALYEVASHTDDTPFKAQSNSNLQSPLNVHNFTNRQVTACCMLCSILNYICCPLLGIPALIFAILGTEADKREDVEAAKSHAFHLKIFNIIYTVIFILHATFYILVLIIVILMSITGSFDAR
ncbi:hypothetical protein LOD99_7622 [Oopsacas minuta]|uniref:Uncharacterized protein n=1 Tax=Oopsacas minuta TaxID=111878 RepID=A0AAV7JP68_9METZ|nr:hypothetical protein LOD99_7622 [Oopsacas minuta]